MFWVINELKKTYDDETLSKGGLTVKTTLDREIQQAAESAVNKYIDVVQKN